MNEWWENPEARPWVPPFRRHLVAQIQKRLESGLAPAVIVRGSRQIGKTTSIKQLIFDLLEKGIPPHHIFWVQFDEIPELIQKGNPILDLFSWYEKEILQERVNAIIRRGQKVYFFLDEIQNITNWAPQLKQILDTTGIRAIVTGSSALRIEKGRDSLAGRISTINAGLLSLTEIGTLRGKKSPPPFLPDNGISQLTQKDFWKNLINHGQQYRQYRDEVFSLFSQYGAYPIAHTSHTQRWEEIADQLNETIIQRVIQHDLRLGEKGRKRDAVLLEELFRMACRYAGQTPTIQTMLEELRTTLHANVGPQRVTNYLRFLNETLLVILIPPLEIRLKKKKSASKICIADHSLRASWLQEIIPLTGDSTSEAEATSAGHLAESIVGSTLSTIHGLDLSYYPQRDREPEVDFILTIGQQRIPLEVKYRNNIRKEDLQGITTFMNNKFNNAPFGIVITREDIAEPEKDNILFLPLKTFLLLK